MTARSYLPGAMFDDIDLVTVASAGQERAQLEHEARYGRELVQRLEELMRRCREENHSPSYGDLLALGGEA